MAYDKVVDSAALDAALGGIADAIRGQTGGEGLLGLEEMAAAIGGIKNADDYLADVMNKAVGYLINDKISGKLPTAFQSDNRNLVSVDLPSLTELGQIVFNRCSNLKTVNLPAVKKIDAGNFDSATSLQAIYMPELTTITGYGYSFNNSGIVKAVFPKLTSKFGDRDFYNCTKLTALVLGADTVVPLGATNTFTNTPIKSGTGYIYVPAAQLAAYKSATNWSALASQFRAIEDYPGIMEV